MALPVADFPALIRWLATKHHKGALYPMAKKTGLSSALFDKWAKGTVKDPKIGSLYTLSLAYKLPPEEVVNLVRRPPRRARRALACLVGALSLGAVLGCVPQAHASGARQVADNMADSVKRFRRRVGFSLTWSGFPRQTLAPA